MIRQGFQTLLQRGDASINRGSEYTPEEVEFLRAVEAWKTITRVRFPSYTDLLYIAHCLGYRKVEGITPPSDVSPSLPRLVEKG